MTNLGKYISWNEALVDHFVENGSTVWYVIDSVIESIGQKYSIEKEDGVSYTDDFLSCVFLLLKIKYLTNATYIGIGSDKYCLKVYYN